jgi:hypothetical protein
MQTRSKTPRTRRTRDYAKDSTGPLTPAKKLKSAADTSTIVSEFDDEGCKRDAIGVQMADILRDDKPSHTGGKRKLLNYA